MSHIIIILEALSSSGNSISLHCCVSSSRITYQTLAKLISIHGSVKQKWSWLNFHLQIRDTFKYKIYSFAAFFISIVLCLIKLQFSSFEASQSWRIMKNIAKSKHQWIGWKIELSWSSSQFRNLQSWLSFHRQQRENRKFN